MSEQYTLARRHALQVAVNTARKALDDFDRAWAAEHGLIEGAILRTNESGAHDGRRIRVTHVRVATYRTSPEVLIHADGRVLRQSDGAESRTMGTHTIRIAGAKAAGSAP